MKIYIANWKMQLNYAESLAWCTTHQAELAELTQQAQIIICPTLPALPAIAQLLQTTNVKIGAQNCASEKKGPFTGEVSAATLAQIGTTYCLVGHSERRRLFGETSEDITKKIALLTQYLLTPIVCIANREQFEELRAVITIHTTYIAFEPTQSIGTGTAANIKEIEKMLQQLRKLTKKSQIILYGGSVNEKNIQELKQIESLDGFLVGNASLDFQLFKKIVLS